MKKSTVIIVSGLLLFVQACDQSSRTIEKNDDAAISYAKSDLVKIKWIEGKWRGLAGNEPFYEMYHFLNDSTIEITTYEWNGTDSTKSKSDLLHWKDNAYYLGKDQHYKVTSISNKEIKMIPVKASNDILWKSDGDTAWIAVLQSKNGTNTYHMKPFDPFKNKKKTLNYLPYQMPANNLKLRSYLKII